MSGVFTSCTAALIRPGPDAAAAAEVGGKVGCGLPTRCPVQCQVMVIVRSKLT